MKNQKNEQKFQVNNLWKLSYLLNIHVYAILRQNSISNSIKFTEYILWAVWQPVFRDAKINLFPDRPHYQGFSYTLNIEETAPLIRIFDTSIAVEIHFLITASAGKPGFSESKEQIYCFSPPWMYIWHIFYKRHDYFSWKFPPKIAFVSVLFKCP